MKKFFATALVTLSTICCLLTCASLLAHADTVSLSFVSTGGQSDDGYYVYPYNFSIDGSAATTPLMCLSFTQEINLGDHWIANVYSITGNAEEEAGWLFNDASLHPGNIADDQFAVWELFDPGLAGPDQTGINAQLAAAASGITNWTSSDFANYVLFLPVPGSVSQSIGDYPQTFLGDAAAERNAVAQGDLTGGGITLANAPVPESSGLILLGTGLLGFATVVKCRRRSA
jgi:hypothetical protein